MSSAADGPHRPLVRRGCSQRHPACLSLSVGTGPVLRDQSGDPSPALGGSLPPLRTGGAASAGRPARPGRMGPRPAVSPAYGRVRSRPRAGHVAAGVFLPLCREARSVVSTNGSPPRRDRGDVSSARAGDQSDGLCAVLSCLTDVRPASDRHPPTSDRHPISDPCLPSTRGRARGEGTAR